MYTSSSLHFYLLKAVSSYEGQTRHCCVKHVSWLKKHILGKGWLQKESIFLIDKFLEIAIWSFVTEKQDLIMNQWLPFSALCHWPKELLKCVLLIFLHISNSRWESISYLGSYMHTWCVHIFYGKSMHWPWPGRLWKISQERAESIHFLSNTTLDHRNIRYLLTSHCSPLVSKNTFSDFTLDFWNRIRTMMDQWAFDCAIKRGLSHTTK